MKIQILAAAVLALSAAAPAFAQSCTTAPIAGVGGPDPLNVLVGPLYQLAGFSHCFNFSLPDSSVFAGSAFQDATLFDPQTNGVVNLTAVQLYSVAAGASTLLFTDNTAEAFSFANLNAGDYRLVVTGDVVPGQNHKLSDMAFSYYTVDAAATPVTPSVPEPATYAMMAMGLLAAGAAARRRA